jgi:choline dehydrogenase-like flavoprotein
MDKSYVLDAEAKGADIYSSTKVTQIDTTQRKVNGVEAYSKSGFKVKLTADTVVLAASAIQSPLLLLASGIDGGPTGEYFQCHPGVSVSGRFPHTVHNWRDATQGHEVIGLRHEGLKFESAAMDISVMGMRLPGAGEVFMENLQQTRRHVDWAAAVKSSANGRIQRVFGKPLIRWSPSQRDVLLFRRGAYVLGKMLFAAGASQVYLGVNGWSKPMESEQQLDAFGKNGSRKARDYNFAVTHMFGTCRMGTDKNTSVVGADFQHHRVQGLYIADSSVFPTNTGVNPQTSILALSRLCARKIIMRV